VLSARGLRVKPGNTLPKADTKSGVFRRGSVQKGIFDVKQPLASGALRAGVGMDFHRYSDATGRAQQIDPDIFELIEEPIVPVDDDFVYYDEGDLNRLGRLGAWTKSERSP
jgi:hypothetical protein